MVTRSQPVGISFLLVLLAATAACTNNPGADTPTIAVQRHAGYATRLTARQLQGMAGTGDRFTMATAGSLPKRALTAPKIASLFARSASPRKLDAIVLGFLDGDTPVVNLYGNLHRTFNHRLVWLVVTTGREFISGPIGDPRPNPPPTGQMWSALDPMTGKFLGARTLPAPEILTVSPP